MRYLLILLLAVSMQARSQDLTLENTGLQPPVRLNCTSVKDQSNSSTCWSFSAVSFLESEMMRQHIPVADLSEMFVARYSYIRKIERHLALKGGNFYPAASSMMWFGC
ncbi:MAG: hypothetical protein IPP93_05865 [Chitinophagaceae bacterium]|nr:hypothetical protein [Chitinophagaceae bacterium]